MTHDSATFDVQALRASLVAGECTDNQTFDQLLPQADQLVSSEYWTPLQTAVRAARWLDHFGARSVVDVGSGVGKFCVAGALASQCRFIGVEQRARLVCVARALARVFEVEDRVEFVQSTTIDHGLPEADAYYLYNPFGENICSLEDRLDSDVELGLNRYKHDIAAAEQFINDAPAGTYLLTYNGFGGRVADSYEVVAIDRNLPYELCMWRKARSLATGRAPCSSG